VLAKGKEFLPKYAMSPPTKNWGQRRTEHRFMRTSQHGTENVKTYDMTECGTSLYATNTNIINKT